MPKYLIKYKLHGNQLPWYVERPGILEIDNWFYGVSRDDSKCYIPSDVEKLNKKDLKDLLDIQDFKHQPVEESKPRILTKQEKSDYVDKILQGVVISDKPA